MRIYLASRYSRRLELCEYRSQLEDLGYDVQARWLNGQHQILSNGQPIGENVEALIEDGDADYAEIRGKFARDDLEDVSNADVVISFTEPPRSNSSRGGRHVEFGIALANGAHLIVVGYRENIFHCLPEVKFAKTWETAKVLLGNLP